MELQSLRQSTVLRAAEADVGVFRERARQARLAKVALALAVPTLWLWWRIATHDPIGLPRLTPRASGVAADHGPHPDARRRAPDPAPERRSVAACDLPAE